MRTGFWVLAVFCVASHLFGDEPAPAKLAWEPPFSPATETEADARLVFLIVTNDRDTGKSTSKGTQRFWCQREIEFAIHRVLKRRPDIVDNYALQHLPAGMPTWLTGDRNGDPIARCLVMVCDGRYRLLSVAVGVPDVEQCLTLIEDSQFVSTLLNASKNDQAKLTIEIAEQSKLRTTRIWKEALNELMAAMDVKAQDEKSRTTIESKLVAFSRVSRDLDAVYLADSRMRFGLNESSDIRRLTVLEQHCETRLSWANAVMPLIASADVHDLWRPLTEAVWRIPPLTEPGADSEKLLDWLDNHHGESTYALVLEPSFLSDRAPWPPPSLSNPGGRSTGWKELHASITRLPTMLVDPQQFCDAVDHLQLTGIDLYSPSRLRYILMQPGKKIPWLVREGDVPMKHFNRLERLQKAP